MPFGPRPCRPPPVTVTASPPRRSGRAPAIVSRLAGSGRPRIIGSVSLLLRAGEWDCVTPQSAGWRYLSFRVERLDGHSERATAEHETALVLLDGACSVDAGGDRFELGPRAGVFEGLPWTL